MAITITEADAAKLRDKELANIIRKLNGGRSLTASERALLDQARAAGSGGTPSAGNFAKSWEELAAAVKVDRRTLTEFRKKNAVEIKVKGRDLTRADGRHCIAAWTAYLRERGVVGRGINAPPPDDLADGPLTAEGKPLPSESVLKRRKMLVDIERAELNLSKEQDASITVAVVNEALGHMLATFRQSMDALPARCAGRLGELDVRNQARDLFRDALEQLRGARDDDEFMQLAEAFVIRMLPEPDYHYRREIIAAEVEIVKGTLRAGDYLQPRTPEEEAARAAAAKAREMAKHPQDAAAPVAEEPEANDGEE